MWLWINLAWADPCATPTTLSDISAATEEAWMSYAAADEDGFRDASLRASEAVTCVTVAPTAEIIADVARVQGLLAFIDGNDEVATEKLTLALTAEPNHRWPARIAPEGGRLWKLYEQLRAEVQQVATQEELLTPSETTLSSESTPSEEESLFAPDMQEQPEDLDEPVKPNLARNDNKAEPLPTKPVKRRAAKAVPWWVGMGVSGGAAAGLFGASIVSRNAFDATPTEAGFKKTNGLAYGSIGAGALALGLGTVAIARSF